MKREFYENGHDVCPLVHEWEKHERRLKRVDDMGDKLERLIENTSHLANLDPIASTMKLLMIVVIAVLVLTALEAGRNVVLSHKGVSTNDSK